MIRKRRNVLAVLFNRPIFHDLFFILFFPFVNGLNYKNERRSEMKIKKKSYFKPKILRKQCKGKKSRTLVTEAKTNYANYIFNNTDNHKFKI